MGNTMVVQHESEGYDANSSNLEQMFIQQYLAKKGYTLADLKDLPPEQAKSLFTEACEYSSLKLTEIELTAALWSQVGDEDASV